MHYSRRGKKKLRKKLKKPKREERQPRNLKPVQVLTRNLLRRPKRLQHLPRRDLIKLRLPLKYLCPLNPKSWSI